MKMEKNLRNKIVIGIIIFITDLLVIYFGTAIYFRNHYFFGSEINCISVSGKSVEKVKEQMNAVLKEYKLSLKERGDKTEDIKAEEIGLRYEPEGGFEKFKERQNPLKWISAFFTSKESKKLTVGVAYDEELLRQRVDKLSCFDVSNIVEPKNPVIQYVDSGYVIIDEINGNKVDKEILYKHAADTILKRESTMVLEEIDCYVKPQYTSKSPKIVEVKDILNKYISSRITYTFGEQQEVLDSSIISKWISVNENFEVVFDEGKVKWYVEELANKYNTLGKTRSLAGSSGRTVSVGGGDYGWVINTSKEAQALSAAIKEGQTITKEPAYSQTAFSRSNMDIGNTYVEIDMTRQHLWFYKGGNLIVEGDVVTGNMSSNHTTPQGIYRLKYKEKNAVLRGPDYAAPVSFWMPFNGGIGMHDASWRSEFGGNIFRTNGSHGCINCPYFLAKTIYENITEGTPVICYY